MKKFIFIFITSFLLFACTEEVFISEIQNHTPKLVIEANIDIDKENPENSKIQQITISKTSNFYSKEYPPVLKASISVTDEEGNSMGTFLDINGLDTKEDGIYTATDFIVPESGKTYLISIDADGQNYTGKDTYNNAVNVDEIEGKITTIFEDVLELTLVFENEIGKDNYYLIQENEVAKNEQTIPVAPYLETIDDEFYPEEIGKNSIDNATFFEDYEDLKQIDFRLYEISRSYYNYMTKLTALADPNGGGPFSTAPATIRGNFFNNTNKDDFALGYFSINQFSKKSFVLDEQTLKDLNNPEKTVKQ